MNLTANCFQSSLHRRERRTSEGSRCHGETSTSFLRTGSFSISRSLQISSPLKTDPDSIRLITQRVEQKLAAKGPPPRATIPIVLPHNGVRKGFKAQNQTSGQVRRENLPRRLSLGQGQSSNSNASENVNEILRRTNSARFNPIGSSSSSRTGTITGSSNLTVTAAAEQQQWQQVQPPRSVLTSTSTSSHAPKPASATAVQLQNRNARSEDKNRRHSMDESSSSVGLIRVVSSSNSAIFVPQEQRVLPPLAAGLGRIVAQVVPSSSSTSASTSVLNRESNAHRERSRHHSQESIQSGKNNVRDRNRSLDPNRDRDKDRNHKDISNVEERRKQTLHPTVSNNQGQIRRDVVRDQEGPRDGPKKIKILQNTQAIFRKKTSIRPIVGKKFLDCHRLIEREHRNQYEMKKEVNRQDQPLRVDNGNRNGSGSGGAGGGENPPAVPGRAPAEVKVVEVEGYKCYRCGKYLINKSYLPTHMSTNGCRAPTALEGRERRKSNSREDADAVYGSDSYVEVGSRPRDYIRDHGEAAFNVTTRFDRRSWYRR